MSTVFFWFSNLDLTLAFSIETTSATRLGFQDDHHLRDIGGLQQLERRPPPPPRKILHLFLGSGK